MNETVKRALLYMVVALISAVLLTNFHPIITVMFVAVFFFSKVVWEYKQIK